MGQTIICEYLANKQPDPVDHGFDGIYSMLEECQNVMFALGESANAKGRRIAELEQHLRTAAREGKEMYQRIVELKTQLAALATIEQAATPDDRR
jgi:hypothetical protein